MLPKMADKYEAKHVVRQLLGEDRSVPTAALFETAGDIELGGLPQAVALKATHGSGWNIIARNKDELDQTEVRDYFHFWLKRSYYIYSKEWAYRDIRPRVICEPLLIDENSELPLDYKIFCFAGQAHFVQVDFDRFINHTRKFYDTGWNEMEFSFGFPISGKAVPKPNALREMVRIAETISSGFPFLRVDFYVHQGKPFVGELTFYPENGMGRFTDESWNHRLGDMLELPLHGEHSAR